jgi:hypothetical protein
MPRPAWNALSELVNSCCCRKDPRVDDANAPFSIAVELSLSAPAGEDLGFQN